MQKNKVETMVAPKPNSTSKKKKNIKNVTVTDIGKKTTKKKIIPKKDKIEVESNIEVVEQTESVDIVNIQNYNEQNNELINKIFSYVELRKKEVTNKMLTKYYKAKEEPFFYIDMNIPKSVLKHFLSQYEKIDNQYYHGTSIYFYNVINSKCLNIIFYFLKDFFKLYHVDCFQNCCEMISLTQIFFFILLTDFYFLHKKIKSFCAENLKLLFKIKKYLFEKYIKCINASLLKKSMLLNEEKEFLKKTDFFIFETKVIKETDINIMTDTQIKKEEISKTEEIHSIFFEKLNVQIYCYPKKNCKYLINVIIKNNSYEYINDILYMDLFYVSIFTNRCCNTILQTENSNIKKPTSFNTKNEFNEEKDQSFYFIYTVEFPYGIYKKQNLEIVCVDTRKSNVKHIEPFQLKTLETEKENNDKKHILEITPQEKEEISINNGETAKDTKQNETTLVESINQTKIENGDHKSLNGNISNGNIRNIAKCHITDEKEKNSYDEKKQEKIKEQNENDVNLVKVKNEKYTMKEKTYLKIYSNMNGNFYINLNNVNSIPYIEWKLKYENDKILINLKSKMEEFVFEINNEGIYLLNNMEISEPMQIFKDIYGKRFDIYMLLFLMKTKGINLLITNIEIKAMMKKQFHLNDEKIERNIIKDILLCFRFLNFSSSTQDLNSSKIVIQINNQEPIFKTICKDFIQIEYGVDFCRITKIIKKDEKEEKKFINKLSKHTSVLFCLYELCEYHKASAEKTSKGQIGEKLVKENEKENVKEKENNDAENSKKNGKTTKDDLEVEKEKNEGDLKTYGIILHEILTNIFAMNKIEQINELIKESDTLKKSLIENEKTDVTQNELINLDESNEITEQYNDLFEINEIVYNLYFFLKLTKIIPFTNS